MEKINPKNIFIKSIANKKNILLFFVVCVFTVSAQFYPTKIYLHNGDIIDCYAKFPINDVQKKVVYKSDLDSKKKNKLKSDEINSMLVTSKDEGNFILERSSIKRYYKTFGGEIKFVIPKRKTWNLAIFYNQEFQVYRTADKYRFNKKGVLISIARNNGGPASFWISYKRKGEDCPTYIKDDYGSFLFAFGEARVTRKMLEIYFQDEPEFAKRFSDKKYTKEKTHIDIAEEYTEYTKEKNQSFQD